MKSIEVSSVSDSLDNFLNSSDYTFLSRAINFLRKLNSRHSDTLKVKYAGFGVHMYSFYGQVPLSYFVLLPRQINRYVILHVLFRKLFNKAFKTIRTIEGRCYCEQKRTCCFIESNPEEDYSTRFLAKALVGRWQIGKCGLMRLFLWDMQRACLKNESYGAQKSLGDRRATVGWHQRVDGDSGRRTDCRRRSMSINSAVAIKFGAQWRTGAPNQ